MDTNKLHKMIDKLDHYMEFGYDIQPGLVDLLRQMVYHIDDLQLENEQLQRNITELEGKIDS